MTDLKLFIPITKVDAKQRLVYGVITEEVPDKAGEVFDYDTGKLAVQKWSEEFTKATNGESKGNLRAMHDNVAAGKFTDIVYDDAKKRIEGVAKVVDDDEWSKVQEGVYTGFSIGGGYAKRWKDETNPGLTRYTPELCEVSLVDNPCVPTATFEFIKEDGSTELRKFNSNEGSMTDQKLADAATVTETAKEERPQDKGGVRQVWLAKDGSTHDTKAEALHKNVDVDAQAAAAPALEAISKIDAALSKAENAAATETPTETGAGEAAPTETVQNPADASAAKAPEGETAKNDEPAAKAEKPEEIKKGMYDVSRFAEILQAIQWLQQDTEWEAKYEGDNSELPAKIKAWMADGATLLQEMIGEEAAELTADKASGNKDLAKAAETPQEDLAKVTAERDAISKVLTDLTPKLEGLLKRVETLEAQPMPAKGVRKVVAKEDDTAGSSSGSNPTEAFTKHLDGLTPEQRSNELMKLALRNPIAVKS